jgi:uncharacterized protein (DUF362 family)
MPEKRRVLKRRDFLKSMGLGAAGAAAATTLAGKTSLLAGPPAEMPLHHFGPGRLYGKPAPPARVSLVKGNDRRDIIYRSLKLIEDEVLASIKDKTVLVKPNVVLMDNPLGVTHIDALRAVLDFLTPHYKKQIIIGEAGHHNTMDGYKNYGYFQLEKEYNVKIVDLNPEPYQYRYVISKDTRPIPIRIINTFLDPKLYMISLARMKTHNYVFVTLSLKNVLLAAPVKDAKQNDKALMHTAPPAKNDLCHYNMFHLAQEVYPELAVIDGFEGMEGNGPAWGTPIASKVALASLDPLAADITATRVMGFDPKTINYLAAMAEAGMGQGDFEKIRLLGTPLDQCICKYKPNEKMAELYKL